MISERPPLSLYVHLPWCVRKCPYCDFNSHERPGELPEQAYLRVLLADLKDELATVPGRRIGTVFFGGGTPSLLSAGFYREFLARLNDSGQLAADAEITLEANPGTLEAGRFEGFREAGINRLSIGVQSFDALQLHNLGRIHGPEQAMAAARAARAAGFDDFNLDLMHGLPGQTPGQALNDLEQAIALAPTHISWYELTIEPNTAFWSRPPEQPDPDRMAETEEAGFALLAGHGYQRYEISAFAREDHQCRHNLNYWHFGDYLGIGAGAHGKLTTAEGILRYRKTRRPEDYMDAGTTSTAGPGRVGETLIPEAEQPLEFLMNGLRLVEGVPREWMESRTRPGTAPVDRRLAALREQGLLVADPERLACTPAGLAHLNTVLLRLAG